MNIEKGLTLTLEQKKDDKGNVIQPLTDNDLKEFNDKLNRLFHDYGLLLSRFGDIPTMQTALCKQYKKQWQEKAFNEGVNQTCYAYNKANNIGVPIIKPVFVFDELNK